MSRIAGVFSSVPAAQSEQQVRAMLAATSRGSRLSRATQILSCQGCTLGYWGDDSDNEVWQDDRFAIVADGARIDFATFGTLPKGYSSLQYLATLLQSNDLASVFNKIVTDGSFAIFDKLNKRLWLVRDKCGQQPLFHSAVENKNAFCSRIAGLLTLPSVSRTPRHKYLAVFAGSHYRGIDNSPEEAPLEGMFQVPAGMCCCISEHEIKLKTYWQLSDQGNLKANEQELAEEYRAKLIRAVQRRITAAQRPAFTLSGGMDSSSVLALAVHLTGIPQTAFSSAYSDPTYDERLEIQPMLTKHVSNWQTAILDEPRLLEHVAAMIEQHDEPVATVTWFSHFQIMEKVAQQGFKTLFGGLGGDELNAGEFEYFPCFFADLRVSGQEDRLQHEIQKWAEYHDHPVFKKNAAVAEKMLQEYFDLSKPGVCRPNEARLLKYVDVIKPEYFELANWRPYMAHPYSSALKNRTFQDIFYETAPCCLRAQDRQGEAQGVRHSLPFFDSELVEFMFRVPGDLKIREGMTKYLLRQAMKGILPEETRTRVKKTGWNAPAHLWFLQEKNFSELMDLIHSSRFSQRGIFNAQRVEQLLLEHKQIVESGQVKENHMMLLWQILNAELWLRWLENFSH